jgi:hypothetical protein
MRHATLSLSHVPSTPVTLAAFAHAGRRCSAPAGRSRRPSCRRGGCWTRTTTPAAPPRPRSLRHGSRAPAAAGVLQLGGPAGACAAAGPARRHVAVQLPCGVASPSFTEAAAATNHALAALPPSVPPPRGCSRCVRPAPRPPRAPGPKLLGHLRSRPGPPAQPAGRAAAAQQMERRPWLRRLQVPRQQQQQATMLMLGAMTTARRSSSPAAMQRCSRWPTAGRSAGAAAGGAVAAGAAAATCFPLGLRIVAPLPAQQEPEQQARSQQLASSASSAAAWLLRRAAAGTATSRQATQHQLLRLPHQPPA